MAIKHSTTKAAGEKGYASEWNANHVIEAGTGVCQEATVIVASSTSKNKDVADYQCDGVDDQVEIQKAFDDVRYVKGTVLLLEGTYNISHLFNMYDDTTLEGVGWGTILNINNTANSYTIKMRDRCKIKNLKINVINEVDYVFEDRTYTDCEWSGIYFTGIDGLSTLVGALRCLIINNTFALTSSGDVGSINALNIEETIIANNFFTAGPNHSLWCNGNFRNSLFISNIMHGQTLQIDGNTQNSQIAHNVSL